MERDIPKPGSKFRTFLDRNKIGESVPITTEVTAMVELQRLERGYLEYPTGAMRVLFGNVLHTLANIEEKDILDPDKSNPHQLQILAYLLLNLSDSMRSDLSQGMTEYFDEIENHSDNKSAVKKAAERYVILTDYLSGLKTGEN